MRNKNKGGDEKAEKTQKLIFKTSEIKLIRLFQTRCLDSVKMWAHLWKVLLHKIQSYPLLYERSPHFSSNI